MHWRDTETGNTVRRIASGDDWLFIECVETGDRGRVRLADYREAFRRGVWVPIEQDASETAWQAPA